MKLEVRLLCASARRANSEALRQVGYQCDCAQERRSPGLEKVGCHEEERAREQYLNISTGQVWGM